MPRGREVIFRTFMGSSQPRMWVRGGGGGGKMPPPSDLYERSELTGDTPEEAPRRVRGCLHVGWTAMRLWRLHLPLSYN